MRGKKRKARRPPLFFGSSLVYIVYAFIISARGKNGKSAASLAYARWKIG